MPDKWAITVEVGTAVAFVGSHEEAQNHRALLLETIEKLYVSKGLRPRINGSRILRYPESEYDGVPTL
jgi:hypothetical protein